MESRKVLLRFETPFSLRNPNTLRMVLIMASTVVMFPVVLLMLYRNSETQDVARLLSIVFAGWLVMGAIPCALMLFNGYARIRDEDLVVNATGFFEKRYSRTSLQKSVVTGGRVEIWAGGKSVASMPDSEAARELVRALGIPVPADTAKR